MTDVPPPPLPGAPKKAIGDDAGMRVLLPVGRSGHAIAAGYLALFSILLFPAPFALLFGILGVRDIQKSKDQEHPKHGMGRAIFGIVVGGLGTVVLMIVLVSLLFG